MGLFKKCLCAYPCCHPEASAEGSPRAYFYFVPNEVRDARLTLGRTKEGLLGRIKKVAWQEGARDFFETAFELKFGLAIIFAGRIFLPLIALDNDYSPFFSLL